MKKSLKTHLGNAHPQNPSSRELIITGTDELSNNVVEDLKRDKIRAFMLTGLDLEGCRVMSVLVEVGGIPVATAEVDITEDRKYLIPRSFNACLVNPNVDRDSKLTVIQVVTLILMSTDPTLTLELEDTPCATEEEILMERFNQLLSLNTRQNPDNLVN